MDTIQVPLLEGAKITAVRTVNRAEWAAMGMSERGMAGDGNRIIITLSTGVKLVAWRDAEGNGPGHMMGLFKGDVFDIMPE